MNQELIYYHSPIGILEMATDGTCISKLLFVNTPNITHDNSRKIIYPSSISTILKTCMEQLDEYFAGTRTEFTVPTAQTGTGFQLTVWKKLSEIPYGHTISYSDLSKRIGNTKAIRAVGTANGRNQISILIPCHRVIGSNGQLVGYAGDLWRKQWLLEHEGKNAHGIQTLF